MSETNRTVWVYRLWGRCKFHWLHGFYKFMLLSNICVREVSGNVNVFVRRFSSFTGDLVIPFLNSTFLPGNSRLVVRIQILICSVFICLG